MNQLAKSLCLIEGFIKLTTLAIEALQGIVQLCTNQNIKLCIQ